MSDAAAKASDAGGVRRWEAPEYESRSSGPLTASRLAAIEENAHAEGLKRGFEEGLEQGSDAVNEKVARLAELFAALDPQAAILDETLLTQIGELVMIIAKHFVRRELKHEPGEIVRVVREGLAALPVADCAITVSLHPDDVALVTESIQPDGRAHAIRIVEDVTLTQGGARVETDVSVVDATVEARLGAIAAAVFGDDRQATTETDH